MIIVSGLIIIAVVASATLTLSLSNLVAVLSKHTSALRIFRINPALYFDVRRSKLIALSIGSSVRRMFVGSKARLLHRFFDIDKHRRVAVHFLEQCRSEHGGNQLALHHRTCG